LEQQIELVFISTKQGQIFLLNKRVNITSCIIIKENLLTIQLPPLLFILINKTIYNISENCLWRW